MIAKHQPAVRVRFIDKLNNHTSTRSYDYLVPDCIPLPTLHEGGFVIVNSAGSGTHAVCRIEAVLPLGSYAATKPISGTAQMPDMAREAERERITKALDAIENEQRNNPMARYARLARDNTEAAQLYARLCQL